MKVLIDGDILLYEVGFTTEDLDEPLAFARMDERIISILDGANKTTYQVYLSDSQENNFRYKVDVLYKANRLNMPKPLHYNALKEYLIVEHKAKIAHGMEADDALGINQTNETIIATIDKDLKQVPGLHYSWPINRGGKEVRAGLLFEVSEDEGIRHFYKQILMGDNSDYVIGIKGLGPKTADRLIADCRDEEEMQQLVCEKYKEEFPNWEEKLDKNSQLLWILREEDGFFKFPFKEIGFGAAKQTRGEGSGMLGILGPENRIRT